MAEVAAIPAFKKRSNKSSNIRKRPATPPPNDSESEYTSDDGAGGRVKRRRKDGVVISTTGLQTAQDLSKTTVYAADRTTNITTLDDATKTSNWYLGADRTTVKSLPQDGRDDKQDVTNDGNYRGVANYDSFIQKNPESHSRQVGPVKASTNVRVITTTDFAPDVCKDYKQTGFCGFGDSCKFLHAREDYEQGWQLDRAWEKNGRGKGGSGKGKTATSKPDEVDDEQKMLDNIPFACVICKQPYKMPVVTKCGHYFCEKCAMQRYMKEKKRTCAACGADTNGTFNVARKLKELLDKKKQRMEEKVDAEGDSAAADQEGG